MRLRTIPSWKRTPFLRIIIPFSAGIALEYYSPFPFIHNWLAIVSSLLLLISLFLSPFHLFRLRFITGLAVNLFIFCSGAVCLQWSNPLNDTAHLANALNNPGKFFSDRSERSNNTSGQLAIPNSIDGYIVSIDSEISERAATFRCFAKVHFIINGEKKYRAKGRILFYFPRKDSLKLPSTGTIILVHKLPIEIPSSQNPGGFDFKTYCSLKGIYYQQFLTDADYKILLKGKPNWFDYILFTIRDYLLAILRKNVPGTREAGLAEALLIGYKEDLDDELLDSYSNTGVVHVIAISGLHLALIYWILDKLSKLLTKKIAIRSLLVIAGLWLFTVLAGASPSVARSAAMFTVIVIGTALNKRSEILNGLAASAFLLLVFDPYWLWDLGFQLSYAAVLSLVLFAKPVYDLFYVKNKALDQLWKMTSVTIAAQVCTIPVILYHFHQFPVYFILTNIICVPLSSAILILELLLSAISFIPFLASITGSIIFYGIRWMNGAVEFFDRMPFGSIDYIHINPLQVLILFAGIIFLYVFLKEPRSKTFLLFLLIITVHCSISFINNLIAESQSLLIVYNIPKTSAIDLVRSRSAFMIADSSVMQKRTWIKQLEPSRIYFRIRKNSGSNGFIYPGSNKVFEFGGKTMLLLNTSFPKRKYREGPYSFNAGSYQTNKSGKKIDLVIISSSPNVSIKQLIGYINPEMVVIDGSNSRKKINSWKAECAQLSIACHVTSETGAFVMNLNSTNFAPSHKDFDQ